MKIPKLIIPILAIITLVFGVQLRFAFTQPTTETHFENVQSNSRAVFTVQGLKCKGTAGFFTSLFQQTKGIASITTYATEFRAEIEYDDRIISEENIKAVIEQEIKLRNGMTRQVFTCID